MGINFDNLPNERPGGAVLEKGTYLAEIQKAEMKANKNDATKPPYLAVTLIIKNPETGETLGKVYDNVTESENEYVRFKLKKFVEVLGLQLKGNFELKDLAKVATGKQFLVDLVVDEKATPPKSVIDIFSADIYYPLDTVGTEDTEINAPDAVDAAATPTETTTTQY